MGLFDRFFKKPAVQEYVYTPASEAEAWMGILYACMVADGGQGKDETSTLVQMFVGLPKFEGIDCIALFRKVANEEVETGGLGMVQACSKVIAEGDREAVFERAMEIVLADGEIDEGETMIIQALKREMQISDETSDRIIDKFLV